MTISEKIGFCRSKLGPDVDGGSIVAEDVRDMLDAAEVVLAMRAPSTGDEVLDCRTGAPCVGGAAYGTVIANA